MDILFRHLILEFSAHLNTNEGWQYLHEDRGLMLEKHGIIPNIDHYISIASNYFLEHINFEKNDDIVIMYGNKFSKIENCIFNKVNLEVNYHYFSGDSYGSAVTWVNDKDCFRCKMTINANRITFLKEFNSLFAHELLHYYDNKMRCLNSSKGLMQGLDDGGYFLNNSWGDNNIKEEQRRVRLIKYFLTQPELSAYISGLREELRLLLNSQVENAHDVFNKIKKTNIYSNLKYCQKLINLVMQETDKTVQKNTILAWNEISKNKIQTYSQLKKLIKNVYEKRFRHFITKVSKIAYDVYSDYCNGMTLPSTTKKLPWN